MSETPCPFCWDVVRCEEHEDPDIARAEDEREAAADD